MVTLVGQPAPLCSLTNQHGQRVDISGFVGRKNVVLVFYPFAFSSVCSNELVALRDASADFMNDTTALLAVSCDPMYTLRVFADRHQLPFSLLSDFWPHGAVSYAFGAFNPQLGCASRATFIIDQSGVVRWQVRNQLPQARSLDDYRDALAEINPRPGADSEGESDLESDSGSRGGSRDGASLEDSGVSRF